MCTYMLMNDESEKMRDEGGGGGRGGAGGGREGRRAAVRVYRAGTVRGRQQWRCEQALVCAARVGNVKARER